MECCWWLANKEKYWVYKGHFFIPPSFINMWFYWHIKVAYIQNVQCGSRWCKSWSWKVQEPGTIRAGDNGCPSLKRERVCASFIFLFQWTGWCPSGISSFSPLNQILISSRNTPQAHPEIMFTSYLGLFSPVKLTHLIHTSPTSHPSVPSPYWPPFYSLLLWVWLFYFLKGSIYK